MLRACFEVVVDRESSVMFTTPPVLSPVDALRSGTRPPTPPGYSPFRPAGVSRSPGLGALRPSGRIGAIHCGLGAGLVMTTLVAATAPAGVEEDAPSTRGVTTTAGAKPDGGMTTEAAEEGATTALRGAQTAQVHS